MPRGYNNFHARTTTTAPSKLDQKLSKFPGLGGTLDLPRAPTEDAESDHSSISSGSALDNRSCYASSIYSSTPSITSADLTASVRVRGRGGAGSRQRVAVVSEELNLPSTSASDPSGKGKAVTKTQRLEPPVIRYSGRGGAGRAKKVQAAKEPQLKRKSVPKPLSNLGSAHSSDYSPMNSPGLATFSISSGSSKSHFSPASSPLAPSFHSRASSDFIPTPIDPIFPPSPLSPRFTISEERGTRIPSHLFKLFRPKLEKQGSLLDPFDYLPSAPSSPGFSPHFPAGSIRFQSRSCNDLFFDDSDRDRPFRDYYEHYKEDEPGSDSEKRCSWDGQWNENDLEVVIHKLRLLRSE
ncbi:hypothetical protein C8J56DRAFT_420968 [Mycena floridula]|nr:hypothetical protein C8J56DRAFT_420968 [Mycena floridula]